jgi:hypothetical protein
MPAPAIVRRQQLIIDYKVLADNDKSCILQAAQGVDIQRTADAVCNFYFASMHCATLMLQ